MPVAPLYHPKRIQYNRPRAGCVIFLDTNIAEPTFGISFISMTWSGIQIRDYYDCWLALSR